MPPMSEIGRADLLGTGDIRSRRARVWESIEIHDQVPCLVVPFDRNRDLKRVDPARDLGCDPIETEAPDPIGAATEPQILLKYLHPQITFPSPLMSKLFHSVLHRVQQPRLSTECRRGYVMWHVARRRG